MSSIVNAAVQAGHNINSVSLGIYMATIWNEKVKKLGCGNNYDSGYRSLVERPPSNKQLLWINEPALESISQFLLVKHQGWFITSTSFEKQHIVLMKNRNQAKNECVDGQHNMLQICVYLLLLPETTFIAND